MFKNALIADPVPEKASVYRLYTEFIQASGRHFTDKELMIYMIIELISGVSYNAILFQQPRSLQEIKPFLYEAVRNIIRQFLIPSVPIFSP